MVLHAALTQDTLEVTGKYVEGTIQELIQAQSTVQLREAYSGESDMDSLNSNIHRDHTFLYRAWTAKKPLATTNDSIGLIKFDDLVKQTRTFKERLLG
ncbi:hypothetical protein FG05_30568 [Fusarium graminearum]|nr:hypothetical protein FG05_30568 [Fusarium graminearum]